MARKRMIAPSIWDDPTFNRLNIKARLAFIGLISNADDFGLQRGDYGSLKRLIFGFDKEDDEQWLPELKKVKNLHFYEVSGEVFVHLAKWDVYQVQQKDRKQTSTFPKCSICLASDKQPLTEVSKLSKKESNGERVSKAKEQLREQWGQKRK